MIEFIIACGTIVACCFGLAGILFIGWSVLMDDDNVPVREDRMDCFCSNVGASRDIPQYEVVCDDCGRYAEIGGGE